MSDTTFEVTYRVGFADMNAFFDTWQKRTWFDRTNRRRFLLYSGIILALTIFSARSLLTGHTVLPFDKLWLNALFGVISLIAAALMSGFLAFILTFIVYPLLTYAAQILSFAFGPMRKRTSQVHATAAGVDKTTGDIESRTKWREFTAVVETKRTVLLFTNRNSATIVPKSAFASPDEAQAFASFAKTQWDEAQSIF